MILRRSARCLLYSCLPLINFIALFHPGEIHRPKVSFNRIWTQLVKLQTYSAVVISLHKQLAFSFPLASGRSEKFADEVVARGRIYGHDTATKSASYKLGPVNRRAEFFRFQPEFSAMEFSALIAWPKQLSTLHQKCRRLRECAVASKLLGCKEDAATAITIKPSTMPDACGNLMLGNHAPRYMAGT